MTDQSSSPNPPAEAAEPLLLAPSAKESAPVEPKLKEDSNIKLLDPFLGSNQQSEPEYGSYRWGILISTTFAIFITGAIAGYYNSVQVFLVDVRNTSLLNRCFRNPLIHQMEFT